MKRFMNKKLLVVGVAVAVLLGVGGAAFAYFTTTGSGNGSAQVGTPSSLTITQLGTPAYNSTVALADYTYSQAFSGTQIMEFGNEVNLAYTGPLTSAVVAMTMCDGGCGGHNASVIPSYVAPITVSIYAPGNLTMPLTSDTENITVPAVPVNTAAVPFNATFSNFSPAVVLPSTVVYGISYTTDNNGADGSIDSLNVNLSTEPTNVSVGSDTDPGYVFANENTDVSGTSAGEQLTCSPLVSGFTQYPTAAGSTGCGETTQSSPPYYNANFIPAVELNVGIGDLYPGGPALPISFSVYNPGTIPDALNAVTITVATDTNGLVEAVPGETWTDVAGCYAGWFTINPAPAIDGSVAAGQTWVDAPSGASIVMPPSASDQDACEGATIGLTFAAS